MTTPKWPLRVFTALAVIALGARADAQQPQPQIAGNGAFRQPAAQPKASPIIVFPQINTLPGIPAWQVNQPAFNPGPFFNPALNNPYLNQTRIVPYSPLFAPNNPFVNNPFALNLFNNPFVNNPFNNPFVLNPFVNPAPFATFSTPPIAFQQPGQLLYRGPNLQVNPISGLVYRPLSGVARTADGSLFFHVPGTGLPTFTGAYAPGTGLYYDPAHNTFLNPGTGVLSRPGVTNVFIPWIRG